MSPYNNAARQETVNNIAEYVGASSGTARKDGVPGTDRGVTGYGYAPRSGYGYGQGQAYGQGNGFGFGNGFGLGFGNGQFRNGFGNYGDRYGY